MGLPVVKYVAASNVNDVVPEFLDTGEFTPRPSIPTVSNAMDVGDPSNFARMLELYENNQDKMLRDIHGDSYTDEQTEQAISRVYKESGYLLDPHGAVGFLALEAFLKNAPAARGFFLETAHPAKFLETVQPLIDSEVPIPERLEAALDKPKQSVPLAAQFPALKEFLLTNR
jgi:threonine synthase